MSAWLKIGIAAVAIVLTATAVQARHSTRWSHFPLTQCGPDRDDLCPLRSRFDDPPFKYHLAIYPGCIKTVRSRTPYGIRYERILVCG